MLALLRDEFQDDDLVSKRRASERLDLVAKALGPERARQELVPWLRENLEQEDEILYIFACKCTELLGLLGGGDDAACLLPVLESLLSVEETYVRDAATVCTRQLVQQVKKDALKSSIVDAVVQLSNHEWFTARMSACALCGPTMTSGLSGDDAARLKETYFALCKDETPMVRRCASKELGSFIASMAPEQVVAEVVPLFNKLVGDAQESVAMNWIGNVGPVMARLTPKLNEEHMLASLRAFCADRSWRVRFTTAQSFGSICEGMGKEGCAAHLLPLYSELLRDPEGEVRSVASKHAVAVCGVVGGALFAEQVLPVMAGLVEMDQQRAVRLNLAQASVDASLVTDIGPDLAKEHMVGLWEQFLQDGDAVSAPEVRLIVLNGLDVVIGALGATYVAEAWTSLLKELFDTSRLHNGGDQGLVNNAGGRGVGVDPTGDEIEHPHWRLRVAVIHVLGTLASTGDASVDDLIVDIWASSLADEVCEVRTTAANLLGDFCKPDSSVGRNKVASLFVPKLLDFFKQAKAKYAHRIVFLHAFGQLLQYPDLADACLPAFEKCLDDKVPNVRLAALAAVYGTVDQAFNDRFAKKIATLASDADTDVSAAAKRFEAAR